DERLAAEVYAWQDKLLPLTARVASQVPVPSLWRRIELALDAASSPSSAARPAPRPVPWWQRLGLWQGLSGAAVAGSLAMGMVLVQRMNAPEPARYLAVLQSPDAGATGWLVEIQAGRQLKLVPVTESPAVPEGRTLQFWTKPQGASAPTSLGLVTVGKTVELPVSQLPAVEAQQLFEITLEPPGGSPIGRPTGPILFVGRTVRL
ncbi:MAG: anti-sigma factor, partial [Burkholderiaceae bacterium]